MPGYHLPYFTAAEEGIYAQHGLDVEIVTPEPGPANVRAVAAGRYDLCLTSVGHYLRAKQDHPELGAKFVFMVARHTHMSAFYIDGRPAAHGRPIHSVDDLEGASFIGDPGSPFTREYFSFLRQQGLSPGANVDVPYDEVTEGLAAGKADVAADFLDLFPRFERSARRHNVKLRPLPFYLAGQDVYGSGLVAGTEFIASHPEIVRATVASVRDALMLTRRDPEIGLHALRLRFAQVDPVEAVGGWKIGERLIFTDESQSLGAMDAAKWQKTIAHHADTHGTPRLPPETVFDASFL